MNLSTYILELRTRAVMIEDLQGQIGKLVMVRDNLDGPWKGPCELRQVRSAIYSFEVLSRGSVVTVHKYAKRASAFRKRVLIRDRARLARILLDHGYLPSADGAFVSTDRGLNRFPAHLWNRVGAEVEAVKDTHLWKLGHNGADFLIRKEWTEEVEVANEE